MKAAAILCFSWVLFVGMGWADEAADRAAIDRTIAARLVTSDFDGNLVPPERPLWSELPPAGFFAESVQFISPGLAVAEGAGNASMPPWVMLLRKEAAGWRIAALRSPFSRPSESIVRELAGAGDRDAIDSAMHVKDVRTHEIWCELDCGVSYLVTRVRLVAPGIALADGETRSGLTPAGTWIAVLRKVGSDWQIAYFRPLSTGISHKVGFSSR